MTYIVEPTLRELLWDWLADSGYKVAGEVDIGNGKIDIVTKTPRGEYWGYEVKDQEKFSRETGTGMKPGKVRDLMRQLNRYRNSGYLDRLYFCSQSPADVSTKLTSGDVLLDIDAINEARKNGEFELNTTAATIPIPSDVGVVKVPFDVAREQNPEIVREAEPLGGRTREPEFVRTDESWVQHHIWKEHHGAIREGVLPQPGGNTEQTIDLMIFDGALDATEIYRNQTEAALVGVEVKGANLGSQSRSALISQLERYLNSGGITALYLAVPSQEKQNALDVLSERSTIDRFISESRDAQGDESERDLSNIGLMTVDEGGNLQVVRQASQVEMWFDALRTRDSGDLCKEVGWGGLEYRSCEEFDSVFNQEDPIHRKAREIDVDFSRSSQQLIDAKYKVQSGSPPTERERNLLESAYDDQYGED